MHNSSTTADVSSCNGISETLRQNKVCPDRDDHEQTRPVTTSSIPYSQSMSPIFVLLELDYDVFDASLTYTSDDAIIFWQLISTLSR